MLHQQHSLRHTDSRDVVITGLGIVSCIGLSLKEVTESLRSSKSGISLLEERKAMGFASALSGTITGFNPEESLERKVRKSLPEFGIWAWDAVRQALQQAGITEQELAGDERTGLLFGNDSSTVSAVEQCEILRQAKETRAMGSGHIFRLLTSTISLNLCTKLRLRGSSWTVSGACASGTLAIGQAAQLIASGKQDRMICGGAQEISWQSMCSFDGLGAFSKREDAPAQASRPFDEQRDGLIPSGGAAVVFLESRESALRRNAPILGEICGFATTSDGHHISAPSGEGLQRAMLGALVDAELSPKDIDLVMAHATSTTLGDEKEAEALCNVFGTGGNAAGPIVAAIKSLTGHEFWMAGTSQVVYALLMAQNGFIAAHPNLSAPLPLARNLDIPTTLRTASPRHILCNASGFGGINACLVIGTGC
jgi:3-oxoacyl-[acyl-carrier-protein] synthase I